MKKFLLATLLLLGATLAPAQTFERDGTYTDTLGRTISNAVVRVCTAGTATTTAACSGFVSIYNDYALTQPVNQASVPLVTNASGGFQFFTTTGVVDIQFQSRGQFTVLPNVVLGAGGGGMGGSGTTGYVPLFGSSTTLGSSVLDYGVTNANEFTSLAPLVFPTAAWGTDSTVGATTAYVDRALPTFTPHQFLLNCTGSDESTAFQAMLNTLHSIGGANIQLQDGDNCVENSQLQWYPSINLIGVGTDSCGQWGSCPNTSAALTLGYADTTYGALLLTSYGHVTFRDLAIRTTVCGTMLYQTKTQLWVDNVSFQGTQGSNSTNNACNDAIQAGKAATSTCANDKDCYFIGYGSWYHIFTDKIREALRAYGTFAYNQGNITGNSTDSNSSFNAQLITGTCNDSGNKCGLSSLVCSTNDIITLTMTNGGGSGAVATVKCSGSNAIANGTAFFAVTTPGVGYTSGPTTATATCSGGDTCSGTAAVLGIVHGPFVELDGLSSEPANDNNFQILTELGNAGSSTNPGDAHYSTGLFADYANENVIYMSGYDSANSPYNAIADFIATSNAARNDFWCQYYQSSKVACAQDANSGSNANFYHDLPGNLISSKYGFFSHIGSLAKPVNDVTLDWIILAGSQATITGTGACGTRSNQAGGAAAGQIKCGGSTGASTLTITPGETAPNGWACWSQDVTAGVIGIQTTLSTTAPVISFSSVTSADIINFGCVEY